MGLTSITPAPVWTESPTGQASAILYRVEATGGSMWTVGIELNGGFAPLALRRDGTRWTKPEQPFASGRLDDLAVTARDDVWAVGSTPDAVESKPVLEHWDGSAWTIVQAPELPPGEYGGFSAVATAGPDQDVWVYGSSAPVGEDWRQLLYRYRDGRWTPVDLAGTEHILAAWDLNPITPDNVWLWGVGGIAHFDGTSWKQAELPGDTGERHINIQDVVVRADDDIWAVGHRPDDELWRRPLVLHFDGRSWTEIPSPAITGQLHGIEFLRGRPIAVGENPQTTETLVLGLDCDRFVRTSEPPNAGSLYGSVIDGGRLWAVGTGAPEPGTVPRAYVASAK
ncbi:hypothetical protein [Flindersiella endophytica]